MDNDLIKKFWKEYHIPVQEEDVNFPFANPSDAARSLIKAHNWVGVLTEKLMEVSETLNKAELTMFKLSKQIARLESIVLAANPPPSWAIKNREVMKSFLLSKAGQDVDLLIELDKQKDEAQIISETAQHEYDLYNKMLRALEKSTELAIQYINWTKFELKVGHE